MGTTDHQAEMMRRCAWCGRAFVEGEWRPLEDDVVAHLLARLTHTVCPECVAQMQAQGLSR